MMLLLVLAPLALAAVALAIPSGALRPRVLLAGAAIHAAAVAALLAAPPPLAPGALFGLDAIAKITLLTTTILFGAAAVYAQGYLALRPDKDNRVFVGGLLGLLGTMTTVAVSRHLGLIWVAMEASTLATAPLIYFNRNARSLEATWKYLLIGSLGIALALLGTFFLALSGAAPGGPQSLSVDTLLAAGPTLSRGWVRAAFVFLLVGYGTKMGLAPLHSWKPDAYGEAPGLLGALLAGGLTNFAFLAIVRVFQVTRAAGEEAFARDALVGLGLLSIALAAVFVVGQRDFKRMLAYSSVEHMGILALGIGLGGGAAAGAFFHCLNNGLTKGVVFLSAGNIHRAFGSKTTDDVRGAARLLPISGPLFLAGFLAVTGSPPFSPFFSEFAILNGALGAGRFGVGALFLAFLAVIFVGMGTTVLAVVQGDPGDAARARGAREHWTMAAPPLALLALVLLLGLFLPEGLKDLFGAAAALVGGRWE
jgi:hydrogenase-4 component F